MKLEDHSTRRVYQIVSGNVIGAIEELDCLDGAPPQKQCIVKIGIVDAGRAIDDDDTRYVVASLRAFSAHRARAFIPDSDRG